MVCPSCIRITVYFSVQLSPSYHIFSVFPYPCYCILFFLPVSDLLYISLPSRFCLTAYSSVDRDSYSYRLNLVFPSSSNCPTVSALSFYSPVHSYRIHPFLAVSFLPYIFFCPFLSVSVLYSFLFPSLSLSSSVSRSSSVYLPRSMRSL